jgi:retinol dehydrogenase-12
MGQKLSMFWEQSFFLSPPTFTDRELPDQTGKVNLNTLSVLLQLTLPGSHHHWRLCRHRLPSVSALYSKNAAIYLAGRSEAKARTAIIKLEAAYPE